MLKYFTLLVAICAASAYDVNEYKEFVESMSQNPLMQMDYAKNVRELLAKEPNYFNYSPFRDSKTPRFDCPAMAPSSPKPTSVHRLRPSDIKAVAALGDSLTAGAGSAAEGILGLLFESRGQVFSIGADETIESRVTLPNVLRKYNPNVRGASVGANPVYLQDWFPGTGLNVAVSGNRARHMLDQTRHLISLFKNMTDFDYRTEWKLVTLFIGGNDICGWCKDKAGHHPDLFIRRIKDALDLMQAELPYTFVNLVTVLNAGLVKEMPIGLVCRRFHQQFCRCGAFPADADEELQLQLTIHKYQENTEQLVASGIYDTRDDFTVVVQPTMRDMQLPTDADGYVDMTYFAPDCFHFSQKAHAAAAIGLWNNMLQKVGHKKTHWDLTDTLTCPSAAHPYFYTAKNSN